MRYVVSACGKFPFPIHPKSISMSSTKHLYAAQ